MRRKLGKKLMALTMAGVMMCAPMTVFAATGTTEYESEEDAKGSATGSGNLEGYVDESDQIFKVTLPTDDSSAPTFKFVMDPQNLLKKTDGSNYTTTDTVLFSTKNGTSNELSITNNSQFDVDLSLTAKMTGLTGEGYTINMAPDNTFKDSESNNLTDTSLYLGLIYETATANSVAAVQSTTKAVTADESGVTVTATLGGMPDNYEVAKVDGKYVYKEKTSDTTPATGVAKFKMTGACNPYADWSAIDDLETAAAPTVTVSWTLKKHTDDITVTKTAASTAAITVTTKDEVKSIQAITYNGVANSNILKSGTHYTVSGTSLTLTSTLAGAIKADSEFTLTFADGTTQQLIIDVE